MVLNRITNFKRQLVFVYSNFCGKKGIWNTCFIVLFSVFLYPFNFLDVLINYAIFSENMCFIASGKNIDKNIKIIIIVHNLNLFSRSRTNVIINSSFLILVFLLLKLLTINLFHFLIGSKYTYKEYFCCKQSPICAVKAWCS